MEFSTGPSNCADAATGLSRASLSARSSLSSTVRDFQRGAHTYHAPMAQNRIPAASSLGGHLPASAFIGCSRPFYSARLGGANRLAVQSLAHKQLVHALAYALHLNNPSKACSRAGSINASKGFQGRGIFIQECGKIRTRERSHD